MDLIKYSQAIHSDQDLSGMCEQLSPSLKLGVLNSTAFLKALMGNETAFGRQNVPRYEPAYAPNGMYYAKSDDLKRRYDRYGALASMSYGPWQIMYSTAANLGYPIDRHPLELWDGFVSGPYVIQYLNKQYANGASNVALLGAAYNAGSFGSAALMRAQDYVKKLSTYYQQFLATN